MQQPNKLEFGAAQQKAFDTLRLALISKPVLRAPDMSKPWIIMADASKVAAAAILMQREGEQARHGYAVSFCSKTFLERERNYATVEKEMLSIIFALSKFHHYVYGRQISIHTDHMALKWLNSLVKHSPRLARWSLILQNYQISMHYIIKGQGHRRLSY